MNKDRHKTFRSINYLGSKLRLLDPIEEVIDSINSDGVVCDLFAGTGSVSYRLSKKHRILAFDIQEYSRVLCSSLLKNPNFSFDTPNEYMHSCKTSNHYIDLFEAFEPLVNYEKKCISDSTNGDLEQLCEFIEKGSFITYLLSPYKKYSPGLKKALDQTASRLEKAEHLSKNSIITTKYFGGVYFSYQQAIEIDALIQGTEKFDDNTRAALLAPVLSTVSEVVNTIGKQFAQPINPRDSAGAPKPNLRNMILKDRKIDVFCVFEIWLNKYMSLEITDKGNSTKRMGYQEALDSLYPNEIDVIYADPPYTRDHYSRFYHVLETISLRDNPEVSRTKIRGVDKLSRGLYRAERHQSPFCIKSQAPEAFETLISKSRKLNANLLISYSPYSNNESHPRTMTIENIIKLAKNYYKNVETLRLGDFKHSKLNISHRHLNSSNNAELLIVCKI